MGGEGGCIQVNHSTHKLIGPQQCTYLQVTRVFACQGCFLVVLQKTPGRHKRFSWYFRYCLFVCFNMTRTFLGTGIISGGERELHSLCSTHGKSVFRFCVLISDIGWPFSCQSCFSLWYCDASNLTFAMNVDPWCNSLCLLAYTIGLFCAINPKCVSWKQ